MFEHNLFGLAISACAPNLHAIFGLCHARPPLIRHNAREGRAESVVTAGHYFSFANLSVERAVLRRNSGYNEHAASKQSNEYNRRTNAHVCKALECDLSLPLNPTGGFESFSRSERICASPVFQARHIFVPPTDLPLKASNKGELPIAHYARMRLLAGALMVGSLLLIVPSFATATPSCPAYDAGNFEVVACTESGEDPNWPGGNSWSTTYIGVRSNDGEQFTGVSRSEQEWGDENGDHQYIDISVGSNDRGDALFYYANHDDSLCLYSLGEEIYCS